MEAAYRDWLRVNPTVKQELAEGIFWLADTMENDLREKNPENLDYCLSNVERVKEIAEATFKDSTSHIGTEPFADACARLMVGLPEL